MTEAMGDAREMAKQDHVLKLEDHFKRQMPGRMKFSSEDRSKVEQIYNLALLHDMEDPVGWVKDFDRSHPHNMEFGDEKDRLSLILTALNLYVSLKKSERERKEGKVSGKQAYRDF